MKRLIVTILIAVLSLGSLAACGKKGPPVYTKDTDTRNTQKSN